MKEKIGWIYRWTNIINADSYIGQTKKIEQRKKDYEYNRHKSQVKFYAATQHYGWDKFVFDIIEIVPVEELNDREIHWINIYDTVATGYNLTYGGECHEISEESKQKMSNSKQGPKHNFYGKKFTEQHRKKISIALTGKKKSKAHVANNSASHKGKKQSPETIAKRSIALSGKNSPNWGKVGELIPNWGKKHKPESIQKQSECKMGPKNPMYGKTGEKSPSYGKGRRVRCKNTGQIFISGEQASDHFDGWSGSMYKHLNGERKTFMGYTFEYYTEPTSEAQNSQDNTLPIGDLSQQKDSSLPEDGE